MKRDTARILSSIVHIVFTVVVVGLLLRFLFRLFGANPEAGFTGFLYGSTAPLLAPFRNLFTPYIIDNGNVFEFSTLIAVVLYMLLSWLLGELIHLIGYHAKKTYRSQ